MEEFIVLLVVCLLGLPYLLAVVALVKAGRLRQRLERVEHQLRRLQMAVSGPSTPAPAPAPTPEPAAPATPPPAVAPVPAPLRPPAVAPTPVVPPIAPVSVPVPAAVVPREVVPLPTVPPPLAAGASAARPESAPVSQLPVSPINFEQFMGAKLFAWIGGFVLFLALIFFLKYAFENHLISPEVQVAGEYLLALGVLGTGVWLTRRSSLAVLAQTLCATGVLMLYAVSFAMHAYYHLAPMPVTFAIMALVTAAAFVLAVRLNAQVVAILGLLGGFLTPVLLSTGRDQPFGLFGYIGLLNAGLMAILTRRRWSYQVCLAAVGTVILQVLWAEAHFALAKTNTAMLVYLGMQLLFLVGFVVTQRRDQTDPWISAAAVLPAVAALVFGLYLLGFKPLAETPGRLFGYMALADLGLLALAVLRPRLLFASFVGGGLVYLFLIIWTAARLTPELLNWGLAAYFGFALMHAIFPVLVQRWRGATAASLGWGHLFPILALVLVMVPILNLREVSIAVWVCVLLLDLLIFGLALLTASVLAIVGALLLTIAATALWILRAPALVGGLSEMLVVIGGFALVFFVLGILAARKLSAAGPERSTAAEVVDEYLPGFSLLDVRAQVSALAALLPFLLLVLVVVRLPLTDPSAVFGLGLVLGVLLLGIARLTAVDALALVGLVATLALEIAWFQARFKGATSPAVTLAWYVGFAGLYSVFPFLFRRAFAERVLPWAVGALAAPLHFLWVYRVADAAYRNPYMGLIPAAFAVPMLLGLVWLVRTLAVDNPKRLAILAWWGGAALFLITLIFPIQFERQWITIGWALEGVALLWLYRRLPHKGLTMVGAGLLVASFVRLALNPAVLEYHARSATALWNWYLYAYSLVAVCLFVGARWVGERRAAAALATLGTILAFLLLNIEIADYFTPLGQKVLTFEFGGNFGRDMTYSIGWALFALLLLAAGLWKQIRAARYASLGLLVVTLAKLFLHDLASLKQLYRIGAFVAVAIVLLLASFAYQRFLATGKSK